MSDLRATALTLAVDFHRLDPSFATTAVAGVPVATVIVTAIEFERFLVEGAPAQPRLPREPAIPVASSVTFS